MLYMYKFRILSVTKKNWGKYIKIDDSLKFFVAFILNYLSLYTNIFGIIPYFMRILPTLIMIIFYIIQSIIYSEKSYHTHPYTSVVMDKMLASCHKKDRRWDLKECI